MRLIIFTLLVVIFGVACNTRIEGCLESNAENFDLNAELPCDGCCTYPSLGLTLTQKWGDRNFANTDTLFDVHGQRYQIEDLEYFLTTWSWKDLEDNVFTVDSVEEDCGDFKLRYTPDNIIIDTRKFTYTLGTIREHPVIDSVHFSLGLTRDFSCLDPEDPDVPIELTEESSLWNPATSSLEAIRLVIRKDLATETLDTIFMDLESSLWVPYFLEFEKGTDMQFLLTVNYALWFEDVDIQELSTFTSSINTHFKESIFPTP